jgi:hypothetical protein
MNSSQEIDNLIARHQDWRGTTLAKLRQAILEVDSEIVEDWKYMGSPVWSRGGVICVGNIFKNKVQLVFPDGAALNDSDKLFSTELGGKKWRYIDVNEGDDIKADSLKTLVSAAISYNRAKDSSQLPIKHSHE